MKGYSGIHYLSTVKTGKTCLPKDLNCNMIRSMVSVVWSSGPFHLCCFLYGCEGPSAGCNPATREKSLSVADFFSYAEKLNWQLRKMMTFFLPIPGIKERITLNVQTTISVKDNLKGDKVSLNINYKSGSQISWCGPKSFLFFSPLLLLNFPEIFLWFTFFLR